MDDNLEAASSGRALGGILELKKKETIDPINDIDGGTAEVVGTVNEATEAINEEEMGLQKEDEFQRSDTKMRVMSEGNVQAALGEVKTTKEGKQPSNSNARDNSDSLEDDYTVNHEPRKARVEIEEEKQKDFAIVEESAPQTKTETETFISDQDASVSIFNRGKEEVIEVQKSASAEIEEENHQKEPSNPKSVDENLESNNLVEKHEGKKAAVNKETKEKLSKQSAGSDKDDITEESPRNDDITPIEETETNLKVQCTNREENGNQVSKELEDEDKEKSIQEAEKNQGDANNLQHEMKTEISSTSEQNKKQKVTDSSNITQMESLDIIENPYKEEATALEPLDKCDLPEGGQNPKNTTKRETEFEVGQNLELASVVEKHEHETEVDNEEIDEKLSKVPVDTTRDNITEERLGNEEVTPTEEGITVTDQVLAIHEDEDKARSIHEVVENESDANELRHDDVSWENKFMIIAISSKSVPNEKQKLMDPDEKREIESSDMMKTPYNEREASNVITTLNKSLKVLTEPETDDKAESIKEAIGNQSNADYHHADDEMKIVVSSESIDSIQGGNEYATESNSINGIESSNKTETLYRKSEASIVAETSEECGVSEERGPDITPEKENQLPEERTKEVATEPGNKDEAKSRLEVAEKQSDVNDIEHDQIKTVTLESVQNENENTISADNITEPESLDKMETPCCKSEASIVAETSEECGVSEERGQSPNNSNKRDHELLEESFKEEVVEAEITEEKSLQHTQGQEEDMKCLETRPGEKNEQTNDNIDSKENEQEGGHTDHKDIQMTAYLPITCQNVGNHGVNIEIPADDEAEQAKNVHAVAHGVRGDASMKDNENLNVEKKDSDVLQEKTIVESASHANYQDVEEVIQDETAVNQIPQPTEAEERLQKTHSQLFPDEDNPKASSEVAEEIAVDLKPLPNETEKQLQHQFPELVQQVQECNASVLTKEIVEENMEKIQSLEEKKTDYSTSEQIKHENFLQEEVPREVTNPREEADVLDSSTIYGTSSFFNATPEGTPIEKDDFIAEEMYMPVKRENFQELQANANAQIGDSESNIQREEQKNAKIESVDDKTNVKDELSPNKKETDVEILETSSISEIVPKEAQDGAINIAEEVKHKTETTEDKECISKEKRLTKDEALNVLALQEEEHLELQIGSQIPEQEGTELKDQIQNVTASSDQQNISTEASYEKHGGQLVSVLQSKFDCVAETKNLDIGGETVDKCMAITTEKVLSPEDAEIKNTVKQFSQGSEDEGTITKDKILDEVTANLKDRETVLACDEKPQIKCEARSITSELQEEPYEKIGHLLEVVPQTAMQDAAHENIKSPDGKRKNVNKLSEVSADPLDQQNRSFVEASQEKITDTSVHREGERIQTEESLEEYKDEVEGSHMIKRQKFNNPLLHSKSSATFEKKSDDEKQTTAASSHVQDLNADASEKQGTTSSCVDLALGHFLKASSKEILDKKNSSAIYSSGSLDETPLDTDFVPLKPDPSIHPSNRTEVEDWEVVTKKEIGCIGKEEVVGALKETKQMPVLTIPTETLAPELQHNSVVQISTLKEYIEEARLSIEDQRQEALQLSDDILTGKSVEKVAGYTEATKESNYGSKSEEKESKPGKSYKIELHLEKQIKGTCQPMDHEAVYKEIVNPLDQTEKTLTDMQEINANPSVLSTTAIQETLKDGKIGVGADQKSCGFSVEQQEADQQMLEKRGNSNEDDKEENLMTILQRESTRKQKSECKEQEISAEAKSSPQENMSMDARASPETQEAQEAFKGGLGKHSQVESDANDSIQIMDSSKNKMVLQGDINEEAIPETEIEESRAEKREREECVVLEKQRNEGREEKTKATPTIIESSGSQQICAEKINQEGHSIKDEVPLEDKEKIDSREEEMDEGLKPDEEEVGEPSREDPGSIAPVKSEASRDIDVKATHKKSHNILSGVGSKVKHSISKVKKAITGKSSQPKNTSPKKRSTKGE